MAAPRYPAAMIRALVIAALMLPAAGQVVIALVFSAILALLLGKLIDYLRERDRKAREYRQALFRERQSLIREQQALIRERDRKEREYQQALLDFRWHEGMSPIEFEQCCADYLRLRGWEATTTKGSGDQGVDVVARKNDIVLVVQCKKYSKPVGNKAVQEIFSAKAYMQATFAAVVSSQTYTPAARLLAEKTGVFLLHFTELRTVETRLGLPEPPRGATNTKMNQGIPRVIRGCPRCGTNMRLPAGKSGMVRCPSCLELYTAKT